MLCTAYVLWQASHPEGDQSSFQECDRMGKYSDYSKETAIVWLLCKIYKWPCLSSKYKLRLVQSRIMILFI